MHLVIVKILKASLCPKASLVLQNALSNSAMNLQMYFIKVRRPHGTAFTLTLPTITPIFILSMPSDIIIAKINLTAPHIIIGTMLMVNQQHGEQNTPPNPYKSRVSGVVVSISIIAQDNLDSKNFYACNPSFDKGCGKKM